MADRLKPFGIVPTKNERACLVELTTPDMSDPSRREPDEKVL